MFAEWEEQKGIVLIYPHKFCDFSANLEEVQECYESIITEILKVESLFLIMHPDDKEAKERVQDFLTHVETKEYPCKIIEIASNDVWARDSIALSIKKSHAKEVISQIKNAVLGNKTKTQGLGILDKIINHDDGQIEQGFANFSFNGWGLKYPANLDNQINAKLHNIGLFADMQTYGMVLEGGSIDSNGNGILLTNTQCLLEKNRNPHLSQDEIEKKLCEFLHIKKVLWLHHGFLLGDDTDSHIDTLARFISADTIAYIKCTDLNNTHFSELNAMEQELEKLAKEHNFKLVALPFCEYVAKENIADSLIESTKPVTDKAMRNLPASYINFLFLNNKTLLVPTYNKPTDLTAIQIFKQALPEYTIIGINCEALIHQHGSLHCMSMQIH